MTRYFSALLHRCVTRHPDLTGWCAAALLLLPGLAGAQQSSIYTDKDFTFKQAQEYFQQGKYAVSQPMFRQIIEDIGYFQASDRQLTLQDAQYYYDLCALKLQQPEGERLTREYISQADNNARRQMASYHLARYYFHQNKLQEAIPYYEQAGFDNLSREEAAHAKFELGYAYFNLKQFNKAQPLFRDIKDLHNENYIPANYYYGFIAYYNKDYDEALRSFEQVVGEKKYDIIVPYYIAEIYYYQNKFDKLLAYAQPYLKSGKLYYDADLKHLVGQTYFEKRDYASALPYLEAYEQGADELTKEDVYELAYCYYQTNNLPKAISGFKQLSGTQDSLGQNSMYLLGDCYLKTGQKADARNAFAFCARSSYNPRQQEISRFNYGKLSYELGFSDAALSTLREFTTTYPQSQYNTEAQEILVHLFMNTNDYKNALAVVEAIPQKTPSVRQAYQRVAFGRAMQLVGDGQLQEADRLLDLSLREAVDPGLRQLAYFWKGEIALRNKQYDASARYTRQYLGQGDYATPAALGEANEQTAHYNLGYSLLKQGDYANALKEFQAAQAVFGAGGARIANDARLRAADCYYMMKDYDNAQALYNQAISSGQPGSDYALYQKGIIQGVSGNNDQKLSLLKQLSQQFPQSSFNGDADYQIASTYIADGQYAQAVPYLKKVMTQEANPLAPAAMLKLGLAYVNMDNADAAADTYRDLVQRFPHSPEANEALESLRSLYVNSGNPDAYLNFVRSTGRSLTASAEDSITYAAAEASFANGQYAGAVTQFSNYLSRFPQGRFVLNAHFYRAESRYNQKDLAGALEDYAFVLDQGSSRFNERAAAQAAQVSFYQNKDYAKALGYFQQLQQLSTNKENNLAAARGILRCQYELQNWAGVRTAAAGLLAAANISTDDQIVAHFYAGRAYQQQQQPDSAVTEYRNVSRLTKSELGAESRFYTAQCLFGLQRYKEAETAAYDVIKNTPSYDYWVASAYILLGDIFWKQQDYFNAKATLQSIVDNCKIPELVEAARQKLDQVTAEEKSHSKIKDTP